MARINCDTTITGSGADSSGLSFGNMDNATPTTAGAQTVGVDANGDLVTVDVCAIIDNAMDASPTDPDGCLDVVTSPIVISGIDSVTDNGDATFTHTSIDGTTQVIDVCAMIDDVIHNGPTDPDDCLDVVTSPSIISGVDSVVDNDNGTLTHQSVDGTTQLIDVCKMIDDVIDNGPTDPDGCLDTVPAPILVSGFNVTGVTGPFVTEAAAIGSGLITGDIYYDIDGAGRRQLFVVS